MSKSTKIKTALNRAFSLIEKRPEIGQRDFVSSASVKDGMQCKINEKGWSLATDVPEAMGGENTAPSPGVLFRASISSCVAMGIRMWAEQMDVQIDAINVEFMAHADARGQFGICDDVTPGFETGALSIFLTSDALSCDISKVVKTSLRYSPMLDAIKGRFPIDTKIEISKTSHQMKGAM